MKKKKQISFSKYTGAGNDFLAIENLGNRFTKAEKKRLTVQMCDRNFGVGADGIFFVEKSKKSNYSWDFFNDDGSNAEMCLNASRCFTKYIFDKYKKKKVSFESYIGIIVGEIKGTKVKVRVPAQISNAQKKVIRINSKIITGYYINTGVPHYVLSEKEFSEPEKNKNNPLIRRHSSFGKGGTNVTYMREVTGGALARTFERGVEDYTLACGTGAAAVAAVLFTKKKKAFSKIYMPGGLIEIELFFNYYEALGPAEKICDGIYHL